MQTHHSTQEALPVVVAAASGASSREDEELSRLYGVYTAGDRLAARLAADRRWRHHREEVLQQGLLAAYRVESVGKAGCILAGLLSLVILTLLLSGVLLPGLAVWLKWIPPLCWAVVFLLPLSGLLALCGLSQRRRLFGRARRDVVATSANPSCDDMEKPISNRRAAAIQTKVDSAYADERTASSICVAAGVSSLLMWAIVLVSIIQGGLLSNVGLLLALLISALPLVGLPFAAAISAREWCRRRRLLRCAAREGLAVSDPARYPWHRTR